MEEVAGASGRMSLAVGGTVDERVPFPTLKLPSKQGSSSQQSTRLKDEVSILLYLFNRNKIPSDTAWRRVRSYARPSRHKQGKPHRRQLVEERANQHPGHQRRVEEGSCSDHRH